MLIAAARLFDGQADSIHAGPADQRRGGRIVNVTQRPESPGGSHKMLDLGDVTLLPGQIDIHQHLAFDASDDPVTHLADVDETTLLLRMRTAALRALAGGMTTIREFGDRNMSP